MKLNDLRPAPGSKKERTRKGRGISSGKGKTAGRGHEGQNSRTGGAKEPYFEGGQLPLVRRLPYKPGFRNRSRIAYTPVNLVDLVGFVGEVTPESLVAAGIIKSTTQPVVVLGGGELNHPLTVKAHRFSATAKAKIEAAGGVAEMLPQAEA